MNFLKAYLFNWMLFAIAYTILYFIAPDLWRAGFQVFSAFIGTGLTLLFFFLLTAVAALPRRRWRR